MGVVSAQRVHGGSPTDSPTRTVGLTPWVQIHPQARPLIRALSGGWHYAKDPSGRVIREGAVKDSASHPGDAFGYLVATLLRRMDHRSHADQRARRPQAPVILGSQTHV